MQQMRTDPLQIAAGQPESIQSRAIQAQGGKGLLLLGIMKSGSPAIVVQLRDAVEDALAE